MCSIRILIRSINYCYVLNIIFQIHLTNYVSRKNTLKECLERTIILLSIVSISLISDYIINKFTHV